MKVILGGVDEAGYCDHKVGLSYVMAPYLGQAGVAEVWECQVSDFESFRLKHGTGEGCRAETHPPLQGSILLLIQALHDATYARLQLVDVVMQDRCHQQ